jgi:two-component system, chemotaxis family, sensor kinase CheA
MNELTKEDLEQLYPVFRDQTLEILDEMSDDLLGIEAGFVDEEVIARLRRGAHTIKGDAACIGLERLSDAAHGIEDYLDQVGNDASRLGRSVVGRLLKLLDAIKTAVLSDRPTDLPTDLSDTSAIDCGGVMEGEALLQSCEQGGAAGERGEGAAKKIVFHSTDGSRKASKQGRNLIRVDASKVDDLLNLAGEMMIARSTIEQACRESEAVLRDEALAGRLRQSVDQFEGLITKFQKAALKMRMVPVDMLFRRYSRSIRDMAGGLGKSVELVVSSEKTELDRNLVELLYEPVLHLLRNAIDHGIEPVEERIRDGKCGTGLIRMRAFYEAEEVVLEIGDDGRGIDLDALRQRACETGDLVAQGLSDEDSARLVFADGVSTALAVTKLSGRGIGGAAIKSMVDKVRGTISVKTERGKGTTFILRVPLTLAIMRSLLYSAGGQLFALPLAAIREVVKNDEAALAVIGGVECFRIRGRLKPLVNPCLLLEDNAPPALLSKSQEERRRYLIVVTSGGREFAIATEAVVGVRELVVKPLDGRWTESSLYLGAAVLGDGEVVLIQDVRALYEKSVHENHYEITRGLEYAG